MHEQRVVEHDRHGQRQQPLAVLALGRKSGAMPEVSRRKLLVEGCAGSCAVRRLPGLAQFRALGRRFQVAVRGVFAGVDVAQVAEDVHRLVVAQQDVQLARPRLRLALQAHQQVHDLARIGAAVEQVAQAHDDASCPAAQWSWASTIPVSRSKGEQFGVGAVHVRESDDAIDSAPTAPARIAPRLRRPTDQAEWRSIRQAGSEDAGGVQCDIGGSPQRACRGYQGDLAAIDALEQVSSAAGAPSWISDLRQAHLQLFAFAAHAAIVATGSCRAPPARSCRP